MNINEFAAEIATSGYVAAQIAHHEASIIHSYVVLAVSIVIIAIAVIAMVVVCKKAEDTDLSFFTCMGCGIVIVIAAFSILICLIMIPESSQEIIAWTNDPVTEVVKNISSVL